MLSGNTPRESVRPEKQLLERDARADRVRNGRDGVFARVQDAQSFPRAKREARRETFQVVSPHDNLRDVRQPAREFVGNVL
jgi:hypothetical protein